MRIRNNRSFGAYNVALRVYIRSPTVKLDAISAPKCTKFYIKLRELIIQRWGEEGVKDEIFVSGNFSRIRLRGSTMKIEV